MLTDICQNNKHKELIGQKLTKNDEKTPEQEAEEKKRQIPFHFQINLPQLECVHFVCSMLMEVPNIAANQFTLNKSTKFRTFRSLIEKYDSNAFQGVAETHRDRLVFAARALNESDWRTAFGHVTSITAFSRSADMSTPAFLEILGNEFKRAALHTFLFRATRQYKSFKLSLLSELFEMDVKAVRKQAAHLIMQNKLQMSFDMPNDLLVVSSIGTDIKEI